MWNDDNHKSYTLFTDEDVQIFRVYKLDIMFFNLINSLKKHNYEGLPKESLALATLKKDAFWGTVGLCCEVYRFYNIPNKRPGESDPMTLLTSAYCH